MYSTSIAPSFSHRKSLPQQYHDRYRHVTTPTTYIILCHQCRRSCVYIIYYYNMSCIPRIFDDRLGTNTAAASTREPQWFHPDCEKLVDSWSRIACGLFCINIYGNRFRWENDLWSLNIYGGLSTFDCLGEGGGSTVSRRVVSYSIIPLNLHPVDLRCRGRNLRLLMICVRTELENMLFLILKYVYKYSVW